MKLDGEKGVIHHFLLDCQVRQFSNHTLISYRQHLDVLSSLLARLCAVFDLEQVTVIHLRQCVQHLMAHVMETSKGCLPENGSLLSISSASAFGDEGKVGTFMASHVKKGGPGESGGVGVVVHDGVPRG